MPRGKGTVLAVSAPDTDLKHTVGSGRKGLKRLRYKIYDGSSALNRPSLRRLARRAGVKRINAGIYEEAPLALRAWLSKMVRDACVFAEHGRRFTITLNDILLALKRNGVTLYGFAMTEKRRRLSRPLQQHHLEAATARVAARGAITPSPFVVKPVAGAHTAGKGPTTRAGLTAGKVSVSPGNPVTPARAGDIQTSLSAFRDTVIARQASSDASVPRVAEWVAAHLLGRGKPACSVEELEVVLDALKEQDAVMLTEDEARKSRTVWFV